MRKGCGAAYGNMVTASLLTDDQLAISLFSYVQEHQIIFSSFLESDHKRKNSKDNDKTHNQKTRRTTRTISRNTVRRKSPKEKEEKQQQSGNKRK